MKTLSAWFGACLGILAVAPVCMGEIVLVEKGVPMAVVVTADKPSGTATFAVRELVDHVRLATGATLPVVIESKLPAGETRARILVGDTVAAKAAGLETTKLDSETLVVRTAGNALFLIGGDEGTVTARGRQLGKSGTLYAVYDFLQRQVGVRWLWPGETGTFVPKRESLTVGAIGRRFQPPLIQRNIRGGMKDRTGAVAELGRTPEMHKRIQLVYRLWALRRGLGRRAVFRFGHAYNHWLDKYGKEHPDWFAMMPDGTRVTPEKPYPGLERAKLCVTNSELLDFIAERGVKYLEKNPTYLSFSACPNDSRGFCFCPKCKALDHPDGSLSPMNYPGQTFDYPALSDRYVWFWNELAKRLGDRCPGRYIGAYAYSNYNHPPLREKLSKRVIIGYVGFNYLDAKYNETSRKDWEGWSKIGCKLYLRPNLLLAGHGFPLNYARELGHDTKRCFETGMLGTDFDSMTHQYAAQAPIFYVLTALLWDPTQDVDVLYTEFLRAAYGRAEPSMARYWSRLEQLTREIAVFKDEEGDHDRNPKFHKNVPKFYNPELLAELRALLAAARRQAAGDPGPLARIGAASVAVDYADVQAQVLPAVRRYVSKGDNLDMATRILKRKRKLLTAHLDDFTIGTDHIYWREGRSSRHKRMYGTGLLDELSHPRELASLLYWQFKTDPKEEGEAKGWQTPEFDDSGWERLSSLSFWEDQGHGKYDGYGWYRRQLVVPTDWAQRKQVFIRFGAVDESFRLYIDGKLVHESLYAAAKDPDLWKKPRIVEITPYLHPGSTQHIAVRVHDSAGAGGLWKPVFVTY